MVQPHGGLLFRMKSIVHPCWGFVSMEGTDQLHGGPVVRMGSVVQPCWDPVVSMGSIDHPYKGLDKENREH